MNIEELKKENARLKREIEIEERVTLRWKALAGIFHDTLWSALRRYDPPVYEKLRKEKNSVKPYCSGENKSVQSTFLRMDAGLPQAEECRQQSVPAGQRKERQKEEGERLRQKEDRERLRQKEEGERLRQKEEGERLRQKEDRERLRQKEENERLQQKEENERLQQKEENERLHLKEENEQLQAENLRLQSALAGQREEHKKWEQMAVCFHDTLWQVLLKYEPDTYGPLYPEHKTDEEPDYSHLPRIRETE